MENKLTNQIQVLTKLEKNLTVLMNFYFLTLLYFY